MKDVALDGIRVMNLAYMLPGPYCTMMLGDLGADVILIEPPTGEPTRGGVPGWFSSLFRNQKSLVLNLKKQEGREIFYQLTKKTDIVLEGFRPGVTKKIGIDYPTLKKINPSIVYCSLSAFGQDGPYRDVTAHDPQIVGLSGMFGFSGNPHALEGGTNDLACVGIADLAAALFATVAILSSLIARNKKGIGQYIDIAMLDSLISLRTPHIGSYFFTGKSSVNRRAGVGIFETKDKKYLTLGIASEDHFWKRLCGIIEWSDEIANFSYKERLKSAENLNSKIAEVILTRNLQDWLNELRDAQVPCGPVLGFAEMVRDPQVLYRNMITEIIDNTGKILKQVKNPIKFSQLSTDIRTPPPEMGQHTEEILKMLGYTKEKISTLRACDVV